MNPIELFKDDDKKRSVEAGEMIFREGDAGDYMYVVLEGEVEIRSAGTLLRELAPGDIFGEMALIEDLPRSADAVARTDGVVAPVDERRFLFLVHETPLFALHMLGVMPSRLRKGATA